MEPFTKNPFANNFNKLAQMYQLRLYYIRNSPFKYHSIKYAQEMSLLHKELNFLQSRIILRNLMIVSLFLMGINLSMGEFAIDWKDKFDNKFNNKAYGSLDDSSGEGNVSIDDW